jgi:hypothetical protein
MSGLVVWKRLLWKEMREGWLILAAMFVLPVLFSKAPDTTVGGLLRLSAWWFDQALVIIWASGKATRSKGGMEFTEGRLPTKPMIDWICSFLIPLIAVAAAGAWLARMTAPEPFDSTFFRLMALDLAATFAICYLLSAITSYWMAVAIGMARVATGGLILMTSYMTTWNAVSVVARIGAGCAAGTLVFLVLARRKPLQERQAFALVAALLVALLPYVGHFDSREVFWWRESKPAEGILGWWFQDDRSKTDMHTGRSYRRGVYTVDVIGRNQLEYREARSLFDNQFVRRVHHGFSGDVGIIDATGAACHFAEQPFKSDRVRIIRWDVRSNRTRTLGSARLGSEALSRFGIASISPDERYVLMMSASTMGIGMDLWLLDLSKGNAVVVLDNSAFAMDAVHWYRDKALLYGSGRPVIIDLNTKRGALVTASGGGN